MKIQIKYPTKSEILKIKPLGGNLPIFKVHYIPEFVISKDELRKRFILCKNELGYTDCEICNLSKYLNETGYCYKLREILKQTNVIRHDKQFDFTTQYIALLPYYEFDYRLNDFVFRFLFLNSSLLEQFYNFIEQNNLFDIGDILNNKVGLELKISDKSTFYFDYMRIIEDIDLAFPKPFMKLPNEIEKDKELVEKVLNLEIENLPFEHDLNTIDVISNLLTKRINTAIQKIKVRETL
jgi:hypothetical protein